MSVKTGIQWCDSTVNPTLGCDGCEHWNTSRRTCYAGISTTILGKHRRGWTYPFENVKPALDDEGKAIRMQQAAGWSDLTGLPRPGKPWLDGLPRLIFIGDMADNFSKKITFEFLRDTVIHNVQTERGRRHQWLWLTKRPGRMAQFSNWLKRKGIDWPANLGAGTSITNQATLSRIGQLLAVGDEFTIHFLSVEPQWEALDLTAYLPQLDWVIQGGESDQPQPKEAGIPHYDPYPFDIEWARDILRQCRQAGVPYFLKHLGSAVVDDGVPFSLKDRRGGEWSEWPEDIRVREFPIGIEAARKMALLGKDPKMVEAGKKARETRRKNAETKEPLLSLSVVEVRVQPKSPWSVLKKVEALADEVGGVEVLAEMVETLKELRR
jgi:protein gp37